MKETYLSLEDHHNKFMSALVEAGKAYGVTLRNVNAATLSLEREARFGHGLQANPLLSTCFLVLMLP